MDTQHPFSEAGFDDIPTAVELFNEFGLTTVNLDTQKVAKMKMLADFCNEFADGKILLKQALVKIGNNPESLNRLAEYANLQRKRSGMKSELAKLEKEISIYE